MAQQNFKETFEFVDWLAQFANAVHLSKADDGQIKANDLPKFAGVAFMSFAAFGGFAKIGAEITPFTDEVREALNARFASQLTFPGGEFAEQAIEKIIKGGLLLGDGIEDLLTGRQVNQLITT